MGILRSLFNPNVVSEIWKLMLGPGDSTDMWIWEHESSGKFSVRSCYRFISTLLKAGTAETSVVNRQNKVWKNLWKLPLPNKVKIFAWRACRDALPTKANLLTKQVDTNGLCSFCAYPVEDLNHAVLSCPILREVWKTHVPSLNLNHNANFFELVSQLCFLKEYDSLAIFCSLAWGFWYRRNKLVFEDLVLPIKQVAEHALSLLKSFKSVKGLSNSQLPRHLRWSPPPADYFKLNTDGALFSDLRKAGIGVILRDDKGEVLLMASMAESEVENPEAIELLVVLRGMQLCVGRAVLNVIVESDCLLLVESLQQQNMLDSDLGALYREVMRLKTCFLSCLFTHVFREGNSAAHCLARHAWNVENVEMWEDCIPDFLSQALWLDKCL